MGMSVIASRPWRRAIGRGILFTLVVGTGSIESLAQNAARPSAAKKPSAGLWNPFHEAPDNHPIVQKVLVLNYDPFVPSEGGKRLREVFGWNNPMQMADEYKEAMEYASGGALVYEIVEWRNLNEIYAQRDGYRYTPDEYAANRKKGDGWHDGGGQDYPRLLHEQHVEPLIDAGVIDEVWIFSDHFFGLWEASMAGPGSFNINGGVYPEVAVQRPFAFYGFSYERGVAEMMHNTSHRTEATLNRVYLGWNLKEPKSNWDKFSANDRQSNGVAGVGTCHWPANAEHDYDYGNPRSVQSWADDFLAYPRLTGRKKPVSCQTWADDGDFHRGYMKWYFAHVPRAAGTNPDGRQNNWWKYMFDFENYDTRGFPRPISAVLDAADLFDLGEKMYRFRVTFNSPALIDTASLGDHNLSVTAPSGQSLAVRRIAVNDGRPGTRRVATYEVAAPRGKWEARDRGRYVVALAGGQVRDLLGNTAPAGVLGGFAVRSLEPAALGVDTDTDVLLHGDGNIIDAAKHRQLAAARITYSEGVVGQAFHVSRAGYLRFPASALSNPAEGTVEFWIKPDLDGQGFVNRTFFEAGSKFNNGILLTIDGARNLRLMEWGDDPDTPALEADVERGVGTSAAEWKKGDWHHVAATWSKSTRELALYVDGRRVDFGNNGIALKRFSGKFFSIGGAAGPAGGAEACFDEFRVSHRARSAEEIRRDYQAALGAKTLSIDPHELTLSVHGRLPLTALAIDRSGMKKDVTQSVRWSSANPQVAAIVEGEVRGLKAGTTTISARLDTLIAQANVTIEDDGLPSAKLKLAPKVTAPSERYRFSVTYTASPAIRAATLGYGNVRVVGPRSFSQFAQLQGVDRSTTNSPRTASYFIRPPGGTWEAAANGIYTIELEGWQVGDTAGKYAPARVLGTFEVSLP
jgi:hypothetical protein